MNKKELLGRIDKAKGEYHRSLHLHNLDESVESFPPKEGVYDWVRVLTLDNTKVKEISDRIGELVDLSNLTITKSPVANYSEALQNCKKLRVIKLTDCSLPNLSLLKEASSLYELTLEKVKTESLPDSLGDLESLSKLIVRKTPVKKLPPTFSRLKKLTFLNLEKCPINDASNLGGLPNLNHLEISDCPIEKLPKSIGSLENLQALNLKNLNLKTIPTEIGQLKKLRHLTIENCPLEDFSFLKNMPHLYYLTMKNCGIEKIPNETIGDLSCLHYIDLSANRLKSLPAALIAKDELKVLILDKNLDEAGNCSFQDFSFLETISTGLTSLYWQNIGLERLPEKLGRITNLEIFSTDLELLENRPLAMLGLVNLKTLKAPKLKQNRPNLLRLVSLIKEHEKYEYSEDFTAFLMDILAGRKNQYIKHPRLKEYTIEAMGSRIAEIQSVCLGLISEFYKGGGNELKQGSRLAIVGKMNSKLTGLKKRMKTAELLISKGIDEKTTHIIIGPAAKKILTKVSKWQCSIVTEKDLLAYLNQVDQPYLIEQAKTELPDNLHTLLLHEDLNNQQIAVQLLKEGGVPKKSLTYLFLAFFKIQDKKLKKEVKLLLQQNIHEAVIPWLRKPSFKMNKYVRGNFVSFAKELDKYEKETNGDVDAKCLAEYFFEKKKTAVVFEYLLNRQKEESIWPFLQHFVSGSNLNLSGLRLTRFPERLCHKELLKTITHLDLGDNSFHRLPSRIYQFKQLEVLDLRGNWTSGESLAGLEKLKHLKVLIMGKMNTFPPQILKIKTLEKLILDRSYRPKKLPSKAALAQTNPKLEIAFLDGSVWE